MPSKLDRELKKLAECYGELWLPTDPQCSKCPHQGHCLNNLATETLEQVAESCGGTLDEIKDETIAEYLRTEPEAIAYARQYRERPSMGLPVVQADGTFMPAEKAPQPPKSRTPPPRRHVPETEPEEDGPDEEEIADREAANAAAEEQARIDLERIDLGGVFPEPEPEEEAEAEAEADPAAPPSGLGFVINLATGDVSKQDWGSYPAVMPSPAGVDFPVFRMLVFSVPLDGWISIVDRRTGSPPDGCIAELTIADYVRAAYLTAHGGKTPAEAFRFVAGL